MKKDDQELVFAHEGLEKKENEKDPWKVIIADDDDEVHAVTRMVLGNFSFENRKVQLLSAYSGEETQQLLQKHPDTAIVLLDVVMEEETTGLKVAKFIRDELQNPFVRIILRTGQPGQAPERQVILEYDINDYKEKTDLTAQKLFTTIIGALRAYRDLKMIEKSRRGIERVASISASLFGQQALKNFALKLLLNLSTLLHLDHDPSDVSSSGLLLSRHRQTAYHVLAGTGDFLDLTGQLDHTGVPARVTQFIERAGQDKQSCIMPQSYIGYFPTSNGAEYVLYIESSYRLNDIDKELIRVLETNVATALENILLNHAITETQKEVIFTLGEVVESRSLRTKEHIKHVAAYSYCLALKAGLGEDKANMLKLASPLHDVGKLGIPDSILHKQAPLTEQEYDTLKQHPLIGYNILKEAKQPILKIAAQLALQHHERWDGLGYPQGLRGSQIHILAQITTMADVLDNFLTHLERTDAFTSQRIEAFFQQERGRQFDPFLVELLLEHLDDILAATPR